MLTDKRIVVGVTGGIAAYKAPDLVRRLREAGADVRVAMTPAATEFITPLSLQAVSGQPVHEHLLDAHAESGMGHIELARWPDAVVIAPATGDFMARLASGMANDLVSTLCLATSAPIVLAPSMNRVMWSAPATQRNRQRLLDDGHFLVGPDSGDQACGETGAGRMSEPLEIVAAVADLLGGDRTRLNQAGAMPAGVHTESGATSALGESALHGQHVVITAGPTFESIDPVRGITNHSSGKMGFAIAAASAAAGAKVTLIAGPVALPTPTGIERVDVQSAEDMFNAVHARIDNADIFIAVAAVADYRPATVAEQKIKKHADTLTIELVKNPDIVASVAALTDRPYVVGFAAETNDVIVNAKRKLVAKRLDLVCANRVGAATGGFQSDDNALTLIDRNGTEELPFGTKHTLAQRLISAIAQRRAQTSTTASA